MSWIEVHTEDFDGTPRRRLVNLALVESIEDIGTERKHPTAINFPEGSIYIEQPYAQLAKLLLEDQP